MIGLTVLICFSFILTEKTSNMVKDNDNIMATVKENLSMLEQESVDAKIVDDEIIPGISGKVVDIEKSYQAMKKVGTYLDNLVVYKTVLPTISLSENYDKYVVGGNANKKQVSIIFKMSDDINLDSIVETLQKKEMTGNFFVLSSWANDHTQEIKEVSALGHVFGRLKYDDNENNLFHSLIKINSSQKKYYCYTEEKQEEILRSCSKNKEYTILPSMVIENSLLSQVKKNIQSGSIFSISINKNTLQELSNTLDYIQSKGYMVVSLDTLLEE